MPQDNNEKLSLLDWLAVRNVPNWQAARPLGALLTVVVALLFILALSAAFVVMVRMVFSAGEVTLGAGALIAALLGAPFVIWGTVLKHQTVMFQKEGHMTDRINKAVEQLGAEKTVEWIGRPVEILAGLPKEYTSFISDTVQQTFEERERVVGSKRVQRYDEDPSTGEVVESLGTEYTVRYWPKQITEIETRGYPLNLEATDEIVSCGAWQTFSRTVPNIEVRIGAILSLERIAQDSTRLDRGRDHVRVMEILCAYIRENSSIEYAEALDFSTKKIEDKPGDDPTSIIINYPGLRSDIQMALSVIGRRSAAQIEIESEYRDSRNKPYTLDLSRCNLRKANMEWMNFSNANFYRSMLQGAFCANAKFFGCNFVYAQLTGINARNVEFSQSKFDVADFSFAHAADAVFHDCSVSLTHFVGTNLKGSSFRLLDNQRNTEENRIFFIYCDMSQATFQGDLFGCYFSFREVGREDYSRQCLGVRFCRVKLGAIIDFMGTKRLSMGYPKKYLDVAFADGSVELPESVSWPTHWPKATLSENEFEEQYSMWLTNPAVYEPPAISS